MIFTGIALFLQVSSALPDSIRATAFRDAAARTVLDAARVAVARQDSALSAYDAKSWQRVAIGFGIARVGRERTMFAFEQVGRVRWQRDRGAWVDVTGARQLGVVGDMTPPIPYYPGMEALWIDGGPLEESIREFRLVHPLGATAENHYTYESGDSVSFRTPDGTTVQIRELRIRPRRPRSELIAGSLWFDVTSGQLVRAAYRPSVPLELTTRIRENEIAEGKTPSAAGEAMLLAVASPLRMHITAIAVEYSLHQSRFWLPRNRVLEGTAEASVFRGQARIEQRFEYNSVNVPDSLPPIPPPLPPIDPDTLTGVDKGRAVAGLLRQFPDDCRNGGRYVTRRTADTASRVPIAMTAPCDLSTLSRSPDLPPSIFEPGEAAGADERNRLIEAALSMGAQSPFGILPRPSFTYGLSMTRFNRVEGLSTGLQVDQALGSGYGIRALGRYGFADRRPGGELSLRRSTPVDSIHVTGYRRLVAANDWGDPLSLTSSISAGLFGSDEGFYFRADGIEVGGGRRSLLGRGFQTQWRLFFEDRGRASQEVRAALTRHAFPANITASEDRYGGGSLRLTRTIGQNPLSLRLFGDARAEAAWNGDRAYARGALDLTTSYRWFGVTLSGGRASDDTPPERWWYLGGAQTIRGQSADPANAGSMYWFSRTEIGAPSILRTTLFLDHGRFRAPELAAWRPMTGAGAGFSFFDGLVRLDVARGIEPLKQWRLHLYLDGRF